MRDYSDAPSWATEAFYIKSSADKQEWYYGNAVQYIYRSHIRLGHPPSLHTEDTLKTISAPIWWREPINCIVENE